MLTLNRTKYSFIPSSGLILAIPICWITQRKKPVALALVMYWSPLSVSSEIEFLIEKAVSKKFFILKSITFYCLIYSWYKKRSTVVCYYSDGRRRAENYTSTKRYVFSFICKFFRINAAALCIIVKCIENISSNIYVL